MDLSRMFQNYKATPPCWLCSTNHAPHASCPPRLLLADDDAIEPDAHTIALLEQNIIRRIREENARDWTAFDAQLIAEHHAHIQAMGR